MDERYEVHMFIYFLVLCLFFTLWWAMYLRNKRNIERDRINADLVEHERNNMR